MFYVEHYFNLFLLIFLILMVSMQVHLTLKDYIYSYYVLPSYMSAIVVNTLPDYTLEYEVK